MEQYKNQEYDVIVDYEGGGWYRFSPSGHAYYNKSDEIVVKGKNKLIKALKNFKLKAILDNQMNGKKYFIG